MSWGGKKIASWGGRDRELGKEGRAATKVAGSRGFVRWESYLQRLKVRLGVAAEESDAMTDGRDDRIIRRESGRVRRALIVRASTRSGRAVVAWRDGVAHERVSGGMRMRVLA